MKIHSRGWIFKPTGQHEWSKSHAQVPFAFEMDDKIRVFYATRDSQSRSSVSFVDVDKHQPDKILYTHERPVLSYGEQGAFDEDGTMPSWFLKNGDKIWMYYTAWNKSATASYRLSIGLAESLDGGESFTKLFKGPILDRGKHDSIWVGQPCVLKFSDLDWRMWYLSCDKLSLIDGHPEPYYNVKYATSSNGIDWKCENLICIDFDAKTDAIGRPCVWKDEDTFFMLHSNRLANGYRNSKEAAYRIELSKSKDGILWERSGVEFTKAESGWDNIMNEYTSVVKLGESKYLVFYNGNGFGQTGFGYFIMES